MNITIRRAELRDAEMVAQNVVAMAQDANGIILDPETVRQGVKGLFDRPQLGFYVVAEHQGLIVGSLVIVYEWSD